MTYVKYKISYWILTKISSWKNIALWWSKPWSAQL